MAMNKKEQAELEQAKLEAAKNRALRWSDGQWDPDVLPPGSIAYGSAEDGSPNPCLTRGWTANFWSNFSNEPISRYIGKGVSSSTGHGSGWLKTSSQRPIRLHSSRLRALRCLRQQAEKDFATFLAGVDAEIAAEEMEPSRNYDYKEPKDAESHS